MAGNGNEGDLDITIEASVGDVNSNGVVDIVDAQEVWARFDEPPSIEIARYDVDCTVSSVAATCSWCALTTPSR